MLRDSVSAMALCHNVTPVYLEDEKKMYQASSPDEIALVNFSDEMGIELIHRDVKSIKIRLNHVDVEEEYKILACFPFSSETKRMGIILKHTETKRIIFFLKGAETVMIDKLKPH